MENTVIIISNLEIWGFQLLALSIVMSLTYHIPMFWRTRNILSSVSIVLIGASTGFLILILDPAIVFLFIIVQIYRVFSMLRIIKNRINTPMLMSKTLRSDILLSGATVTLIAVNFANVSVSWLALIAAAQLLIATIMFTHTKTTLKLSNPALPKKFLSDTELPTLTVAIPARNETIELTDCLQNILSSDYPKLEVLVLDDCSQDKTSDIIRKFAHRGVRFLKGQVPPNNWVAKTHAYDQLLDDASGEIILFCGVDVRFEKDSLRKLVNTMLSSKYDMACVLPLRRENIDKNFIIQPMRYWREIVLPRWIKPTPPTLSTCWIIDRSMMIDLGGFEGVRRSVRPEQPIARIVAKSGSYAFIRSSGGLGISSVKTLRSQINTAVRTRYPEHHNRPESVLFTTLWNVVFLIGPSYTFFVSLWLENYLLALVGLISQALLVACHYLVHSSAMETSKYKAILLYPVSVLMEIAILNYSMWAYEFSEVIWKGRNVCLPVLHISHNLPPLEEKS